MKFGLSVLFVSDDPATVEFYGRAFGLECREIKGENFAQLETGDTVIAFASREFAESLVCIPTTVAGPDTTPFPLELALITENVREAFDRAIGAGAALLTEPTKKPWGQTVCHVRDNNGFIIELIQLAAA